MFCWIGEGASTVGVGLYLLVLPNIQLLLCNRMTYVSSSRCPTIAALVLTGQAACHHQATGRQAGWLLLEHGTRPLR